MKEKLRFLPTVDDIRYMRESDEYLRQLRLRLEYQRAVEIELNRRMSQFPTANEAIK